MLRPATPLLVILLAAFVLTLLAVLSAPVIPAIPLGSNDGTTFGVFGYCTGSTCKYGIGYTAPGTSDSSFDVGSDSTRHALTNILIVHPVACLFQLICVILAIVAHFHSPSHSSRYLLALIIFMLPTLLLTLLSFLVDILLFIPHVGWAGWLVLGAVVLDVLSGIMLCAMRRTLVSRKARKKRIQENAEMSGENFYNRVAAEQSVAAPSTRADSPPPLDHNPTVPMVNGSAGGDKLPSFASYENPRMSEDRVPLNERTETGTTASSGYGRPSQDGSDRYGPGPGRGGAMNRGRGGRNYGPPRDEFGNPLPRSAAFGPGGPDRGGYGGRGGPNMGRGGYGGRGGPGYGPGAGRGGRGGAPMGAAFGAGAAAGSLAGSRGPPPGYTSDDYPMQDRPPMNGYGPRRQSPGPPSAPGYGQRRQSPGPPSAAGYGRSPSAGRQRSPGPPSAPGYNQDAGALNNDPYARAESPPPLPGGGGFAQHAENTARAESPPPLGPPAGYAAQMEAPGVVIGQAVEMDERTGSPAQTPHMGQGGFSPVESPLRTGFHQPQSPSSMYSSQPSHRAGDSVAYIPARAAWQTQRTQTPPVELAGNVVPRPVAERETSQIYYEDVDPRFSGEQQGVPSLLLPGGSSEHQPIDVAVEAPANEHLAPKASHMQHSNSYDSTASGPISDSSHFTSISERGVNPAWEGAGGYGGPAPNRGPPRQDVLQSNPDFQLPGGRGRGAPAGGYGVGY